MCTSDTSEGKVKLLTESLMKNGYSLKFMNQWKGRNMMIPTKLLAPKNVLISLYNLEVTQIALC